MSLLSPVKRTSDPLLEEFLGHCHRAQYSAKALIITRGDPADELLYVIKGSVTVNLEDDSGHEIVLAYLNAGQFFGETGLFVENIKRTAFVRARTKCEVAQISYDRLRNLPAIYPHIVHLLATQIATRLLKTNRKVRDLAFLDVSGRIARTLLDLCKEPDAMTHPDGMQISVTRQELGRIVGCSREVVGRVLKAFAQQDLIQVKGKTIVVCGVR